MGPVLGAGGCDAFKPEYFTTTVTCEEARCLADPYPHCVFEACCTDSSQCPSGTYCGQQAVPVDPDTEGQCDGSGASASRCLAILGPGEHWRALTNGFDVREFSLEQSAPDGSPALLTWNRSSDALAVTCALFICPPEFKRVGEFDTEPLIDIANFDQCVLAREIYSITEEESEGGNGRKLLFDVAAASRYVPAQTSCPGDVAPGSSLAAEYADRRPKVTHLLAGCWAYDATRVIAATRLLTLLPSQVPLTRGEIPVAQCGAPEPGQSTAGRLCRTEEGGDGVCSATTCRPKKDLPQLPLVVDAAECGAPGLLADGLTCFATPLEGYGTCSRSACRVRCRFSSDCDGLVGADGAESFACCRSVTSAGESYLGVCLPQGAQMSDPGIACAAPKEPAE
ncbi:hypothetical protein WME94_09345 [Sorangium sp. So ce429]